MIYTGDQLPAGRVNHRSVELGNDIDVKYGFQVLNNTHQTNRDFALRGQFIKPNSGKYTFSVWTKLLSKDYVDGRGLFRSWASDGTNTWFQAGQKTVFDKWVLETFTFDTTGWKDATWYSLQWVSPVAVPFNLLNQCWYMAKWLPTGHQARRRTYCLEILTKKDDVCKHT